MRNRIVISIPPDLEERVLPIVQAYAVGVRVGRQSDVVARVRSRRTAGLILAAGDDPRTQTAPVVSGVRAQRPLLPVLVLLRSNSVGSSWPPLSAYDVELADGSHPPSLHRFVQRALAFGQLPDEAVARWVSFLATSHGLTSREVQLLTMALGHVPRGRMRRILGIGENTLKTQVRGLLRKVGERSLDALAKNLLRTALLDARPGSAGLYRAPWAVASSPDHAYQADWVSRTPSPGESWSPRDRASGW